MDDKTAKKHVVHAGVGRILVICSLLLIPDYIKQLQLHILGNITTFWLHLDYFQPNLFITLI